MLTQKYRAESDDKQRLRIVQRDGLGQGQPGQGEEAEAHGRDADQAARDVPERVPRVERGAQFPRKGQERNDRKYREERPKEHDLARGKIAGRLDTGRHAHEDGDRGYLQPNSDKRIGYVLLRRRFQRPAAAWITDQMRAGVAGISIWPMP